METNPENIQEKKEDNKAILVFVIVLIVLFILTAILLFNRKNKEVLSVAEMLQLLD